MHQDKTTPSAGTFQSSRRGLFRWLTASGAILGLNSLLSPKVKGETIMNDPWSRFCEQLKLAGQQIRRPEAPQDAFNQAEGYRYLSRLLRLGLEMNIECSDPAFPQFYQASNETIKIGGDNPDNHYLNARIDGRYDYLVEGTRGSVHYLSLTTKGGGFSEGSDGSPMSNTGTIDTHQIQVDADGRFQVVISARQQSGNWLPMTQDSNMLLVRQTFLDRKQEQPAELSIRCLNGPSHPDPLDPEQFERSLLAAARFVGGTADTFADWSESFKPAPNQLPPQDQARYQATGGDPTIYYIHGYWKLGLDQALVIEVPPVDADFWNFQVDNYWMESLDYRYLRIHLNRHSAHYNPDGSATLVLCERDPGHPNWLQTAGHREGTMLFRTVHGRKPVALQTRVVPWDQVPINPAIK